MNLKRLIGEYKNIDKLLLIITGLLLIINFTDIGSTDTLATLYKRGFLEITACGLLMKYFEVKRSKYLSKKIYSIYTILLLLTLIIALIGTYHTFNEIVRITWG